MKLNQNSVCKSAASTGLNHSQAAGVDQLHGSALLRVVDLSDGYGAEVYLASKFCPIFICHSMLHSRCFC